jgi:hypothetical protein
MRITVGPRLTIGSKRNGGWHRFKNKKIKLRITAAFPHYRAKGYYQSTKKGEDMIKHIEEERLEAYAMNKMAADEVAQIEEHLLFCETCQDQFEAVDHYVQAMKSAANRIRHEEIEADAAAPATTGAGAFGWLREWLRTPVPIWAGAFAALALIFLIGLQLRPQPGPAVEVELQAHRGIPPGTALAGHTLHLKLDSRGLSETRTWPMEIVDAEGARIWSGTGTWTGAAIHATVEKSFTTGTYFVRLLKEGEEPVREYQLVVRP